jgi:hypothetical protein
MKLLSEDLLKEYGFVEKPHIAARNTIKVMTRDNFDIVIREDGIYYTSVGIDYPLRDTASLRKFYKENKKVDLKPMNPNISPE